MKITLLSAALLAATLSMNAYAGDTANQTTATVQKEAQSAGQHQSININTSSIEQLVLLKGIGESKAKAIVEYRESNGKFKKIDELVNVKGVGTQLVEKNRAVLSL